MSPEAHEALEKSIEHWRQNVAAERPEDASTSGQNCALCSFSAEHYTDYYITGVHKTCSACPVAHRTGMGNCEGTPYWSAASALKCWRSHALDPSARDAWRKAAQAELNFLISLRPTDEGYST